MNKKLLISLSIVVIFGSILAWGIFNKSSQPNTSNWKTLKSDAFGFEFKLPSDATTTYQGYDRQNYLLKSHNLIVEVGGTQNSNSSSRCGISQPNIQATSTSLINGINFDSQLSWGRAAMNTRVLSINSYTFNDDLCVYMHFTFQYGKESWYDEFPDIKAEAEKKGVVDEILSTFKFNTSKLTSETNQTTGGKTVCIGDNELLYTTTLKLGKDGGSASLRFCGDGLSLAGAGGSNHLEIENTQGAITWQKEVYGETFTPPLISDIDSDGTDEVVWRTKGCIVGYGCYTTTYLYSPKLNQDFYVKGLGNLDSGIVSDEEPITYSENLKTDQYETVKEFLLRKDIIFPNIEKTSG